MTYLTSNSLLNPTKPNHDQKGWSSDGCGREAETEQGVQNGGGYRQSIPKRWTNNGKAPALHNEQIDPEYMVSGEEEQIVANIIQEPLLPQSDYHTVSGPYTKTSLSTRLGIGPILASMYLLAKYRLIAKGRTIVSCLMSGASFCFNEIMQQL